MNGTCTRCGKKCDIDALYHWQCLRLELGLSPRMQAYNEAGTWRGC